MSRRLSKEEILDIVEQEGVSYAFTEYLSPSDIEDDDLRRIVERFNDAYWDLSDFLADLVEE